MNTALVTILLGGCISGIVRVSRKYLPKVNPLIWVALLSVVAGMLYAFFKDHIPEDVIEKVWLGFSSAVAIYEVLRASYKAMYSSK